MDPRELKKYIYTKACTQLFIAAFFLIVKKWKQPKHLLADNWIYKMWYIHTTSYYFSHIKEMKYRYMLQHGRILKM